MKLLPVVPFLLVVVIVLLPGCYCSHTIEGVRDGSVRDGGRPSLEDASVSSDGTPPAESCRTLCESPVVLARLPLDTPHPVDPALLDMVAYRGDIAVSLLTGSSRPFAEPEPGFSLVRISRSTGAVSTEVVDAPTVTASVGAAALASNGDTLTLLAMYEEPLSPEATQPRVLIARWTDPDPAPDVRMSALTDAPVPACLRCFRRGAAVALTNAMGLAVFGEEEGLWVGRLNVDSFTVDRSFISVPEVAPDTALEARSDGVGFGTVTMGGTRSISDGTPTPALAMVARDSELDDPVPVPGTLNDAVPHPWVHDGDVELVRFVYDDGLASGRLRRYAINAGRTEEIGTIATAGDFAPLALASTPGALVWAESSLSTVGASDVRVLTVPPASCDLASPARGVHLPIPLAGPDPRVLAATEVDGRVYVAVLEQDPATPDVTSLVVFDLGGCRGVRS